MIDAECSVAERVHECPHFVDETLASGALPPAGIDATAFAAPRRPQRGAACGRRQAMLPMILRLTARDLRPFVQGSAGARR